MLKIDREIAGRNSSLILLILVPCFKLSLSLGNCYDGAESPSERDAGTRGDLIPNLSSASPGPRVEDENATSSQISVPCHPGRRPQPAFYKWK